MQVINHQLYIDEKHPVLFQQSPNIAGNLQPTYVVLHYTKVSNVNVAIEWLCNPQSHSSVHIVISRDGEITQLVRFDTIAWHAGVSAWDGKGGLNKFSIGIMLDNEGNLYRRNSKWFSMSNQEIPDDQVIEAVHKNQNKKMGWHKYTDVQINVVREVIETLFRSYDLKDILGHDDVSPGRKLDPGPAFPMTDLRSAILGPQSGSEPVEERTKGVSPSLIFYSYAHEDEPYKDKLIEHLSILRRRGYISEWHDRMIEASEKWEEEIMQNLELADIILFLVSSSFINSDYIWKKEMIRAMERYYKGEATVIPVMVRPALIIGAPFEKLEMLPKDKKPVSQWERIDDAFYDIATAISNIVISRAKVLER